MRTVAEHQGIVNGLIRQRPTERVLLLDAVGRVLAQDVLAPISLPGFDNSAMDGYAVRAADLRLATPQHTVKLAVTEDIPAGRTDRLTLHPGTAHRIMTGAPM
ncbi:MAG: gephyrin-like molybdotransferase Glp, partial [Mycobacteriaceae bacterium]